MTSKMKLPFFSAVFLFALLCLSCFSVLHAEEELPCTAAEFNQIFMDTFRLTSLEFSGQKADSPISIYEKQNRHLQEAESEASRQTLTKAMVLAVFEGYKETYPTFSMAKEDYREMVEEMFQGDTITKGQAVSLCRGFKNVLGIVRPQALQRGAKVGLVAPASTTAADDINNAIKALENQGFEVVYDDSIFLSYPYGAGKDTIKQRANAFNRLAQSSQIKAIFCLRGGYGSMQILEHIDYEALRANRPIFVGYSDITAMHAAIYKHAGLITFHGPMVHSNGGEEEAFADFFRCVTQVRDEFQLSNIDKTEFVPYKEGQAEGVLIGGNMTLLSALADTPYQFDFENAILFIEEVGEAPYRLNRFMWQLKLSGALDQVSGIIIGSLEDCDTPGEPGSALSAILDVLKEADVPVLYNVQAGHNTNPITLPIGAWVSIDGGEVIVRERVVE